SVRIEEAQKALRLIRKKVEATQEAYAQMAATAIDAGTYFTRLFPAPERPSGGDDEYAEKLARWNAHQRRLPQLYEAGQGNGPAGEGHAGGAIRRRGPHTGAEEADQGRVPLRRGGLSVPERDPQGRCPGGDVLGSPVVRRGAVLRMEETARGGSRGHWAGGAG